MDVRMEEVSVEETLTHYALQMVQPHHSRRLVEEALSDGAAKEAWTYPS